MLISFLVGYAIGYAIGSIIAEIIIRVYSYWNSKEEIREKARNENSSISYLEVYLKSKDTYTDEEELVVKGYDSQHNHVADIKVTAEQGTYLKEGDRF